MQVLSLLLAVGSVSAYTVTNVDLFMFKNIDPIVTPGQYVSHMHSFFGSDAVNVNTTTSAELREGCSTAKNPNDFSVYWVPTLYLVDKDAADGQTHTPITPMRFSAYYELLNEAEIPIPEDFQIVIGNASATGPEGLNEDANVSWACEGDETEEGKELAAFPTKTCSTHLQTLLWFPDCINPDTYETGYSKNPKAFEGYGDNWCPTGMKKFPRLRFSIRYDLRKILPDGWEGEPPLELACGSSYCSHGDFINGWLPEALEYMLNDPSKREYFQVVGPLGAGDQGTACTSTAEDSDPDHGTSDYEESLKMMQTATGIEVEEKQVDTEETAVEGTCKVKKVRRHQPHSAHHRA
ncbi:DUF1996 domain-containing protein [Aspergillus mulundensis]|uniref:DUF1996 domain-containing protein n=1 Tax=Aspergillus mulundensis TaxID=1810919 RepID=A0A3D8S5Q3_9EURO|nr:hypothetical protein DSM5745_05087 [Aspergillus mulundensis]RDW81530.1 hypothetical protein DSM5745_05087 [Aspergillus mulundensis]